VAASLLDAGIDLTMPYEAELATALAAARAAGDLIREAYSSFKPIPDARADITTDADRAAQETILGTIRGRFPDDALCAEEQTPTLAKAAKEGPRLWVVDPIDGTRGFAQKNGEFSVMVAFVDRGRVAVGVVYEPAHRRLTRAVLGGGCWREDDSPGATACRVASTADLAAATLTQSRSKPGVVSRQVRALQPVRVIETHSAGIKLALVARGEADFYVNHYEAFHDWDIAAGHILVEEAGGKVSGLRGEEIRYGSPGAWQRSRLLASNAELHAAVLARCVSM
jgi:3'(2'), 5'-bisphosphate nucleotidase